MTADNHANLMGSVRVLRLVTTWKRYNDCWEAELACGHKMNTGPGSIDETGIHVEPRSYERCLTCEGVAKQVLIDGGRLG